MQKYLLFDDQVIENLRLLGIWYLEVAVVKFSRLGAAQKGDVIATAFPEFGTKNISNGAFSLTIPFDRVCTCVRVRGGFYYSEERRRAGYLAMAISVQTRGNDRTPVPRRRYVAVLEPNASHRFK
jgi:hypothetical protein